MSGANAHGALQRLHIRQKAKPGYDDDPQGRRRITKASEVKVSSTVFPGGSFQFKLGLRIRSGQEVEQLTLTPATGPAVQPVPEGPPYPIAAELESICPAATTGDKWVGFTATGTRSLQAGCSTRLRVKPFTVHRNGFQVVAVAATLANVPFATGHYLVGASVLPGEQSSQTSAAFAPPAPAAVKKPKARAPKAKKGAGRKRSKR